MNITDALLITAYWTVYFALHSILASEAVKNRVASLFPALFTRYRLIYNLVSLVGLIVVLLKLATTPSHLMWPASPTLQFVALVLATWGILVIRLAFRQYDIREFLGILKENELESNLSQGGVLKHVRHPIYSGTILIVCGFFLFNPKVLNLVTLGCVVIYILIGMHLEELKLIQQFGDTYRKYRKEVPAIFPKFKF